MADWFYFAAAEHTLAGEPYLIGPFDTKAAAVKHATRAHVATSGGKRAWPYENPNNMVFIQALSGPYVEHRLIEAGLKW